MTECKLSEIFMSRTFDQKGFSDRLRCLCPEAPTFARFSFSQVGHSFAYSKTSSHLLLLLRPASRLTALLLILNAPILRAISLLSSGGLCFPCGDRLSEKLFRFAKFVYLVHEFCGGQGLTKEIWPQTRLYLLKSLERNAPIGRMIHMNLSQRLRAIRKVVGTDELWYRRLKTQ